MSREGNLFSQGFLFSQNNGSLYFSQEEEDSNGFNFESPQMEFTNDNNFGFTNQNFFNLDSTVPFSMSLSQSSLNPVVSSPPFESLGGEDQLFKQEEFITFVARNAPKCQKTFDHAIPIRVK